MPTIHLLIKGKVQGVFYRATARDVAEEIGITGWIRNTEEENVEAVVSGNREQLKKFTDWCRQGPPKALVSEVIVTNKEDENFLGFKIIRAGNSLGS